ncbi:MAG: hypothetical protein KGS61_09330, partial [Verrucomicrobia bacterium]|nr:hypothetical protein [Verrucomicrobiota bacterium]
MNRETCRNPVKIWLEVAMMPHLIWPQRILPGQGPSWTLTPGVATPLPADPAAQDSRHPPPAAPPAVWS